MGHSTTVYLKYKDPNKLNMALILGIALGVGVPLLIVIFILIGCFCCKKRSRQHRVVHQDSGYLTKREIDLYYPEIKGEVVTDFVMNLE